LVENWSLLHAKRILVAAWHENTIHHWKMDGFPVSASSRGWLIPTYLSLHQGDVKFLRAREWISDLISEIMMNTWSEACWFG
jgi:hypothetical protein